MKKVFLFVLIVLLFDSAHADFSLKDRHRQNTEPFSEFRRVDCGKLYELKNNQKTKILMLMQAAKKDPGQAPAITFLLPEELNKLQQYNFIYEKICKEV